MKENKRTKKFPPERLAELYRAALIARCEEEEKRERHMRQYMGSDEIDGSSERAGTVRNITFEIIESEVNSEIPYPKAEPKVLDALHEKNARAIERLCRTLRGSLGLDTLGDNDERYTYIFGASVFYIEWDSESSGVKIHCLPPDSLVPEPNVSRISDMEYCFLKFSTTKSELMRKWSVSEEKLSSADIEYESEDAPSSDTVNLVIAFYKDDDGEVGRTVFSGELVLSDIPAYYRRKGKICSLCGSEAGKCSCGAPYVLGDILYEDSALPSGKSVKLPYYTPRDFPIVIRKNTAATDSLFGISDCEMIRPQQQAINKIESRILSKLLRSGVTPVMPEDASISATNSVFGQVIRLRPGESADSYGKIDTTPDISADIAEADRLYDQAKRIIGISDALVGSDTVKSESGYARQLKISQATSRLESKKRLKEEAYAEIYRLIFLHYLAFSDEPKTLDYKDSFGRIHRSEFSRRDFIEAQREGGWHYCDAYIFTVDRSGESGYLREALWERNLANLECGSLGEKSSPETLLAYWRLQEKASYPFASLSVEYFGELCEKQKERKEKSE